MYTLPVHFTPGMKAEPATVMYKLDSYHDNAMGGVATAYDPVAELLSNQLQLIERIKQYTASLQTYLVKNVHVASRTIAAGKATPEQKEKGSKKEKAGKHTAVAAKALPAWSLTEEKEPAEREGGITACAGNSIANFPTENAGHAILRVAASDLPWVQTLAMVATTREFSFHGIVKTNGKATNGTVKVEQSDAVSLVVGTETVNGRIAVLKWLGAHFGLFSFRAERAVQCSQMHAWLVRLDSLLCGGEYRVDDLVREMSQFLSRFDSLATQCTASLADIVIFPFVASTNLPNNVELWAKRITAILPKSSC